MALRTLPNLTSGGDFYATMKLWQQTLKPLLAVTQPPSVVLLLSATGTSNGILVSWGMPSPKAGVDGFVLQRSDNANFSQNATEFPIPSNQQTSYLDVQASGVQKWYRLIATSGTQKNPQQSRSKPSGVVTATSGTATTTYDSSQTGNPAKNAAGVFFPGTNNPLSYRIPPGIPGL